MESCNNACCDHAFVLPALSLPGPSGNSLLAREPLAGVCFISAAVGVCRPLPARHRSFFRKCFAPPPPLRNTLYNRPYVASYTIPSLPPYRSEESKRPPSAATDLVRLASAAHISPRCSLEAGDVLRRPARSHAQAAQWTPPQQQSSRGESIRPRMPFMVLSRDEYHVPSVTRIYRVCLFHFPPPQRWLSYCHVGDSGVRRARQAYVHRVPLLGSAFFST